MTSSTIVDHSNSIRAHYAQLKRGETAQVNLGHREYLVSNTDDGPRVARCLPASTIKRVLRATVDYFSRHFAGVSTTRALFYTDVLNKDLAEAGSRNLKIAEAALEHIRTRVYKSNYKSYNKAYAPGNEKYHRVELRRQLAQWELFKTRSMRRCNKVAYDSRAHNCGELADAAVYYLSLQGVTATRAGCSNHVFAIIGGGDLSRLPVDIRLWPKDIAVCDPWANIACPIGEYTTRFTEKMNKWANDGKVLLWFQQGNLKCLPANNLLWLNSVVNNDVIFALRR